MASVKIPNKLITEAVDSVHALCADFFKGRKKSPDRLFCDYFDQQQEGVLRSYQLTESDEGNMTYRKAVVDLSQVRGEESLHSQDRRELSDQLIRPQTMLSFQKNGDEINSPALVLRQRDDGTLDVGDGRHRYVWSVALGCAKANAYVVRCSDDTWNDLRQDFNDMNGAQRTDEERLILVYRKWQQGGHGSIRELCRRHGLSEPKFNEYRARQEAKSKAEKQGLEVSPATPLNVVQTAVKVVEGTGGNKDAAQRIINAGTPVSVSGKVGKAVTKTGLEKVLKPLQEGETTPEVIEEVIGQLKEETARAKVHRGPNVSSHTKFVKGIDMAMKAMAKGSAQEIGLPLKTIVTLRRQIKTLLEYLDASLDADTSVETAA